MFCSNSYKLHLALCLYLCLCLLKETISKTVNVERARNNLVKTIDALNNASVLLQNVAEKLSSPVRYPENCNDLYLSGDRSSGIRRVFPFHNPHHSILVWCDQETDGGGWTVIQRRMKLQKRENFFRSFLEYALGFGDLSGEFWLGLDNIHALVKSSLTALRIDLEDFEGEKRWAKYQSFYVDDRASDYRVNTAGYEGDAGDAFNHENAGHSGSKFSTYDRDNDSSSYNCAKKFSGGWWYFKCHIMHLNGLPHKGSNSPYAEGITALLWRGHEYSLKSTAMLIRPTFRRTEKDNLFQDGYLE